MSCITEESILLYKSLEYMHNWKNLDKKKIFGEFYKKYQFT